MNADSEKPQSPESETSATFEMLPNGKKRYLKATIGDYIFSLILPFWGVVIGGSAIIRGEKKRGQTMILVGVAELILFALLRFA
jgi:hypothetical protein